MMSGVDYASRRECSHAVAWVDSCTGLAACQTCSVPLERVNADLLRLEDTLTRDRMSAVSVLVPGAQRSRRMLRCEESPLPTKASQVQ